MNQYIVMDKATYEPEVKQYDFLFYDDSITLAPNMFAVHPLVGDTLTVDKVESILGGDVMLQSGDIIAAGDICGIVTEIRRPLQPPVDMQGAAARWLNTYHARNPETSYSELWQAAEASFLGLFWTNQ